MPAGRYYDTVVFDVRDNATMLFFARTTPAGDIEDYLLIMRAAGEDFGHVVFLEVNEEQIPGSEVLREATMAGNTLTLSFRAPMREFDNETELVLSFADTAENRHALETGTFRVLGELLSGGHA